MVRTLYLHTLDDSETGNHQIWDSLKALIADPEAYTMTEMVQSNEITSYHVMARIYKGPFSIAMHEDEIRTILWLRDQPKFDVMVSSQSRFVEQLLEIIYNADYRFPETLRPFVGIRFSERYGQRHGVRDDPDFLKTLGYTLDCPLDFQELYDLITMPEFVQAIEDKSVEQLITAVEAFNSTQAEPILVIS